jgi:PAS domain S-box-containing protein
MAKARLGVKILVGTVGIIVFLGLVMVVFARTVLSDTLYGMLQQRGVSLAKHIAQAGLHPLLTERFVELELLVRDYQRSEEDIVYIFFMNSQGEVVAHTFPNGFPVNLKHHGRDSFLREAGVQRLKTGSEDVLNIAVPLLDGSAGSAHIGLSERSVKKDIDKIVGMILGLITLVLAAGTGIAAALSAAITRPVRALAAAAQAAEAGDLNVRVPVRSTDELGLLGTAFNDMIEARRTAEAGLRKSEKKVRDITSSLGEGVLVANHDGLVTFANPEAERLLGWAEAELQGSKLHDIIHGRRADGSPLSEADCPSMRVLSTGQRASVDDDLFVRKEGRTFPVSYTSAPIIEAGRAAAIVMVFRDATQRKQNEADREQLILAYEDALANIKTLKGLMPICASCKKIRDDKGYWNHIESYLREHADAEFSHGICPDCAQKLYPGYYSKDDAKDES